MERTSFLKFIQQKNENCDIRKFSLQSISSAKQSKNQKAIFNIESSAFNNQMPAFINRKVKNLKPYTNHFKRFNIQTTNIIGSQQRKYENSNNDRINELSEKDKSAKKRLLKQLGITVEQSHHCIDSNNKMPQISVFEQFFQKSNAKLSNLIQNFHQSNLKKNVKIPYRGRQNYQSQKKYPNQDRTKNQPHQRRSLGIQQKDLHIKQIQSPTNKNQKPGIKSMNQLPKNQDLFLNSQNVCIIPNIIPLELQKKSQPRKKTILCYDQTRTQDNLAPMNYPFRNSKQQSISLGMNKKLVIERKLSINREQPKKKTLQVFLNNNNNNTTNNNKPINNKPNIADKYTSDKVKSQKYSSQKFNQIQIKLSPQKINSQTMKGFNLNLNIKTKQQNNIKSMTPISKTAKYQQPTSTSYKSKNKIQTLANNDLPLPTNITAFSYIVFQPCFSQNTKIKYDQDNLRMTNKVFTNNRVLASLNCKSIVQIASLTKIMTFLLSIEICDRFKIDVRSQKVRIGKFQSNINGTSAEIKEGEFYTIQQLYYGLMLPSGNDASLALATWGGKKMLIHQFREKDDPKKKNTPATAFNTKVITDNVKNQLGSNINQQKLLLKKKKCYQRFILQMNKKARLLGMNKTSYANSHGLSNPLNKSCAFDLCILCEYAMLNEKFKKVVSTIEYSCQIKYEIITEQVLPKQRQDKRHMKQDDQEQNNQNNIGQIDDIQHENEHCQEQQFQNFSQKQQSQIQRQLTKQSSQKQTKQIITYGQRLVRWQNTHKLLQREQYIGIKTGITTTAGPCLASCIRTQDKRCFIIIVLNSKKLNYRFKDTQIIRKWIYKRQKIPKSKSSQLESYQKQDKIQNLINQDDDQDELTEADVQEQ